MREFLLFLLLVGAPLSAATESPASRESFRLIVEAARAAGLQSDPEVKHAEERALYQAYVRHELAAAGDSLTPSAAALHAAYEAKPLVRLRQLVLRVGPHAESRLATIQKALRSGTSFEALVLKYSQDETARVGGDLDFRPLDRFPDPVQRAVRKLSPNEVSAPLRLEGATVLVQLIARKPFESAPATYLGWLGQAWSREHEKAFLESRVERLKQAAKSRKERNPTP